MHIEGRQLHIVCTTMDMVTAVKPVVTLAEKSGQAITWQVALTNESA